MAENEHVINEKAKQTVENERQIVIKEAIEDSNALEFIVNLNSMNFFEGVQDPLEELKKREGFLAMIFQPWKDLPTWEQQLIVKTMNLSRFENEELENKVPILSEPKMLKKYYDIMFERSVIFLPGLKLDDFSAELLSDYDYLIKVFKDTGIETWADDTYTQRSKCTCRWSAQAIPLLYRMTCQWEISELDRDTLASLTDHFKLNYQRGFMMERTKQNIHQKADANIKSRVFMLYYETEDGVVLDFVWYCIFHFGIFTRTGVLLAYNGFDVNAEMIKCFHLCRTQMLEYFYEKLTPPEPKVILETAHPDFNAGETNIDDLIDNDETREPSFTDSFDLD